MKELQGVISSMSNHKACGIDGIPVELWKHNITLPLLFELIQKIWEKKQLPKEWKQTVIIAVPKPKKNAFRPISLLVTACKVYHKLLLSKMRDVIEETAGISQSGFLLKRSTMDSIMFVRRHREKAKEFNKERWMIFSDVKSAFDTVNREAILDILHHKGVCPHLMELLTDALKDNVAFVKGDKMASKTFSINNGVPQGSSLSPGLFVSALGIAINNASQANILDKCHQKIHADGISVIEELEGLNHIEYADDLCNIVFDKDKICSVLINNSNALEAIGTKLEHSKTEVYHIDKDGNESIYTVRKDIDLSNIEKNSKFENIFAKLDSNSLRYLGDQIGPSDSAIKRRIAIAASKFSKLKEKVWTRKKLSIKTKIKIFKVAIISILTYGLICHEIKEVDLRKALDGFCLRRLKGIFGYKQSDHISYEEMETKITSLDIKWKWPSKFLVQARLSYFISKISNENFQELLIPNRKWKRRVGGTRLRYIDVIIQDLKSIKYFDEEKSFGEIMKDEKKNNKIEVVGWSRAKNLVNLCIHHKDNISSFLKRLKLDKKDEVIDTPETSVDNIVNDISVHN